MNAPTAILTDSAAPDAQQLAAQLAAVIEGRDAERRLREWLEFVRTLLGARAVALVPAGTRFESAVATVRGVPAASVVQLAARATGARAAVEPAPVFGVDVFALTTPLVCEGEALGVLLALVAVPNQRDLQAFAVLLQALGGFVLYHTQRQTTEELSGVLERLSRLLEIFRRAGAERDFEKCCRLAVDGLREYFACQRVVLGLRRRGHVQVRAISGIGRVDHKSPAHAPVEAAFREAQLGGQRIDFLPESPRTEETAAHELLQQSTGATRLTTLPLPRGGGALLLEWHGEARIAPALVDAAAPFLPVLFDLLDRARPNATLFHLEQAWERASGQRRRVWLAGAGALALLLAWPFHYPIKADCRLAPTVKRVIAAPYQGQLRKSRVQPGDRVEEGQTLAEMDNRELRLKAAELLAARDRALKQRDRALSDNKGEGADFAAAQIATFDAQSIGEELALVQRKLSFLEVKSPLAGVVLSGDLRRAEGQPVQQGQVLFEVAPLEEMIAEIEVPDREVSRVREGLPVSFSLEAFGGASWRSTLTRIHPQAEQRDGRNVFIAEAAVTSTTGELRPGMHGRATVSGDRRPLIWILGHRMWEWIVMTFWW